ncbi:MAG: hypothetical protein V1792_29555 [Pseudomonadota bacterium]
MRISNKDIAIVFAFLTLMLLCPAGMGRVYADCRWVGLGDDSYRICDEDGVQAEGIVPNGPATRMEARDSAMRMVQADPGTAGEQREHRKLIRRQETRTPDGNRRSSRQQAQWVSQGFGTSVMGARVKGTIERRGDDLRGVVYVYPPLGKKNTYHFTGKVQGNGVAAWHHSGHSFQGEIVGGRRVVGVVTSRQGTRIPLDVPLGSL